MKYIRNSIFAAALALSTTAAMAADPDFALPTGLYLGAGAGLDSVQNNTVQVMGAPATLKFKDGVAILGSVGYRWDQGYRAELEYSFRNDHAKDANASNFPLTGSLRDNSLMANFLLDVLPDHRFTPYLGAGLGVSWVAFDSIQGGGGTGYSGTSGQFAWQGIAGVSYALSPHWQLTGEVRYKESDRHSYPSVIGATRINRFDDRERDVLIGVRYSFGAATVVTQAAAAAAAPAPAPMARPRPPAPAPAPAVPEKFLVFFDFDKSNLRADAEKIVAEAADYAKAHGKATITATGHTDTMGTAAYNMALSERRAKAVQKQLEKLGIPAGEIVVHWKGKSEPLVQTGDGVKEPQNRRVEIVLE